MSGIQIGEVSTLLGVSADTLRYYEKIGLVPAIARTDAGIRVYVERDLSRLRFIKRAQKMQFSLREIAALLKMRQDPQHARDEVRVLTGHKLDEIRERLEDLQVLHNELQLLMNLCSASKDGCPIIESIDNEEH